MKRDKCITPFCTKSTDRTVTYCGDHTSCSGTVSCAHRPRQFQRAAGEMRLLSPLHLSAQNCADFHEILRCEQGNIIRYRLCYELDGRGIGVRFTERRDFFFYPQRPDRPDRLSTLYPASNASCFPGENAGNADVKNAWSNTSISPPVFLAQYLIKRRNNFTLTCFSTYSNFW